MPGTNRVESVKVESDTQNDGHDGDKEFRQMIFSCSVNSVRPA